MSVTDTEIVQYPIERRDDLTIPAFYREFQQGLPFKVQLPFGEPIWLATRFEDVKFAYGDKRFGKSLGVGRNSPRMHELKIDDPDMLANMDPPRLTRIRRLALTAFAAPQIRAMHDWVFGLADRFLDQFEAAGNGADFVELVSWDIPLRVLAGILGVPEDDVAKFHHWVDTTTGASSTAEERGVSYHNMQEYVRGLIAQRREQATDDLLSVMVHARDEEAGLTEAELVQISLTLFLGGFETTAAQIGSTVFVLMSRRELWEELRGDRELLPGALEELWRWIPSFRFGTPMIRWASEDVELPSGLVVSAGESVLGEHQVANRDESVFANGWEIDFHREEPQPHLSLGWGAHRCLGAHLAHLEIEAVVDRLLTRFPDLELAVAPDEVPWSPQSFLRSPGSLPLNW
jgi:cytochrome P450